MLVFAEVFILYLVIVGIVCDSISFKDEKNYESDRQSYVRQVNEIQAELDEIIANYSDIKGYDYTKYLEKMSYRKLIETYLPELLVPTETNRGYSSRRPTEKLLDDLDLAQEQIKILDARHKQMQEKNK